MSIITNNNDDVFIVMPDVLFDTNTSPEIEKIVCDAIESGETKVLFDFSKTDYLSSAGLRVILKSAKSMKAKGGSIMLCNTNKQIYEVLQISGFINIIKCHNSLDAAIASFHA